MRFSLLQRGLRRYRTTFPQIQHEQQQILRTHIATGFGAFTGSQDISPLTAVLNLPPHSPKSTTATSISTYASLLPITLRLTDSANKKSRHGNSVSVSTAIIGKTAGQHGFSFLNSPTTPHLPLHIVTPPTEACMASTHAQYKAITTTK